MSSNSVIAISARVPPALLTTKSFEAETDAWLRAVVADRRLRSSTKVIAIGLTLFEHDHPTYDEITQRCGCGRRTAIRAIARLVECGWLEKIVSPGRVANQFRRTMRRSA